MRPVALAGGRAGGHAAGMPQLQLPLFPHGAVHLTPDLAVLRQNDTVTYVHGSLPVFQHRVADVPSFRFITSQLYLNGHVQQSDLVRVFGVSKDSVKRAVKRHQAHGPGGFWRTPKRRGASVLTAAVLARVQAALDAGQELSAIAREQELNPSTLNKAVHAGRLHRPVKKSPASEAGLSTHSARSATDAHAPMGVGATDTAGRVAASLHGAGPVAATFAPCADVPRAGVLLAVPALLACGLLTRTEKHFVLPPGYYGVAQIFLLVAFLALARIKSLEGLRYCAPGEWGKVLGLDRVPEVRTLRQKLDQLGQPAAVAAWAGALCQDWMAADPDAAGTLYVDGHVRVYHGSAAHLPQHYVSRQRLCLRATTDYWVNAGDGQPFFVVHRPVDPGLLRVLEEELVPRLEQEVPGQPTAAQLAADPYLHKFTVVHDREGYSPAAFARLRARRVAVLTYHKHAGPDWPVEEFQKYSVPQPHGQTVEMELAERGVRLSNGLWLREIRHRDGCGAQTAILTTNYRLALTAVAAAMFARWSQENFLKYMRQHYALDHLARYQVEPLPATTRVVNPAWRTVERQRRSLATQRRRKLAEFGSLSLTAPIEPEKVEPWLQQKATLQADLTRLAAELQTVKDQRAQTEHHVPLSQVPAEARYTQLSTGSQDLVDTIKLVAYRAETAMAATVRAALPAGRQEEARRLLQSLYTSEADLVPDLAAGTLTVRVVHPANPLLARALEQLCTELTQTQTEFPTTPLRMVFTLVSSEPGATQNPRDRGV